MWGDPVQIYLKPLASEN